MEKLCLKYPTVIKIIMSFLFVAAYDVLLFEMNAPIVVYVIVDLLLILMSVMFVYTRRLKSNLNAVKALQNICDPYPLIDSSTELMKYKWKKNDFFTLKLNLATGYLNIGEIQKGLDILKELEGELVGTTPVVQMLYYNNLASALLEMNRADEASAAFDKCETVITLADKSYKKLIEKSMSSVYLTKAELLLAKGETDEAMKLIGEIQGRDTFSGKNYRANVALHLLRGKAYLALGDKDSARENLQYVTRNGNALYDAVKAQRLLREI